MARRPPGGWQAGTHVVGRLGHVGPEGEDKSPDCYTVDRLPDRKFVVRHYRNASTRQVCCTVEIVAAVGESDVEALARAYRRFELCARR
jgi:hypothetical protein